MERDGRQKGKHGAAGLCNNGRELLVRSYPLIMVRSYIGIRNRATILKE